MQLESYTADGWFLGGGLEVAMHDGWFWRSEVRYSEYSNAARGITGAPVPSAILNFEPVVETATSEIVTSSTGATEAKVELRAGGLVLA
jgi:outer membrane immunogenic protein